METNQGQEPQDAQVQAPQEPQAQPQASPEQDLTLEQALKETGGHKSLKELVKSQKEAHAAITRLSQEKKELEAALQGTYNPAPASQEAPQKGQGDFFDDPESHTKRIVSQEISRAMTEFQARNAIETLRGENPELFDQLTPYMQRVYAQKPYLNNLGIKGLRIAQDEAKQMRTQDIQYLKNEILGVSNQNAPDGTAQTGDLREQIRQEVLAEISRGQGAYIPSAGQRIPDADLRNKRDKAMKDGDVDTLIEIALNSAKPPQ